MNSELLHTVDNLKNGVEITKSEKMEMAFKMNIPGDTLSGYPEGKNTELSTSKTWRLGIGGLSGFAACERVTQGFA